MESFLAKGLPTAFTDWIDDFRAFYYGLTDINNDNSSIFASLMVLMSSYSISLIMSFIIITFLTIQLVRYCISSRNISDLSYLRFNAAPAGDRAAVISIQGQRKYMEDTYQAIPSIENRENWSYYGVYDGHGGARCSVYVAHYLHRHVIAWLDAYITHYQSNAKELINALKNENNSNSNETNSKKNAKKKEKNEKKENNLNHKMENENNNLKSQSSSKNGTCILKQKCIPLCILKIMREVLLKSHRKADQEFLELANRERWKDGSTSVSCLILPAKQLIRELTKSSELGFDFVASDDERWIFCANTGDSRGILVGRNGEIIELSHDHKPNLSSERNRIQSDGGRVVFFGTWRVEGVLAVSRSFGDRMLKRWIIPDPEVIAHCVDPMNDLFLILATDGVWDTVSNKEAAKCAVECWNNPSQSSLSLNQRLRAIAQKITSFAYTRGSMDNITTLVVHIPSHCSN